MPTRETFTFCASCNSKFSIKETCYKCSNLIHDICDKCTAKSCSCCLQKDLTKMNQTKIEIKSCNKCPFAVAFNLDTGEEVQGCSFYKGYMSLRDAKPDFCKVKNIIVEEE